MESVETVTILFTDLVGSTGLEIRAGPGAANDLRGEHFALIRGALEETGGREVKNTGDGVMAAFESASAAVACAVSIQQSFERRNRQSDVQLLVRIGVSLGDATLTDGDYFGLPVIEAARLCDRAQGGQILAKEIVGHLASGRDGRAFKPVGELELKGIPEAVSALEVTWAPLEIDETSLPLPPRLQELPPGSFVGRKVEQERLTELLAEAGAGNRRVVLISGEPGIGKTRLATQAALAARSEAAVVLYGRAEEELAIPYGPWIEAVSHYVDCASESTLRAHVESHGGELARLVPGLGSRVAELPAPRDTDPDTERYLLWGAVLGLLESASRDAPLVLVLDDLHWADKPTLQLIKHVTSQAVALRAVIIATYRESDMTRGHPLVELLADLHREPGVERIALKGLREDDIVAIMERGAGHELDASGRALANDVYLETDGNAFYAGELLRHLLDVGGIYQLESGRWSVRGDVSELGLPESVHEVLGRRIERLGEPTRKALSIASVIGRDFDVDLLARVSESSEDELLELLEEATAASVLSESANVPGRFAFAHALVNHTLYEELGTTRRARLHRRVAEALEDMLGDDPGERVAELAQHWGKATTAVDLEKAIHYAQLAAERALSELAPAEAVRWYTQAREFDEQDAHADHTRRCDLLIGLGEAQRQAGEAAFRETLLEASRIAAELGDAGRAAAAALANSRGVQSVLGEVDVQRMEAIDRAIELDGFANPARCARLMSLQALELQFGPANERGQALAHEAIARARDAGDDRALAHVLRDGLLLLDGPDNDLEFRRGLVDELLDKSERLADPALQFWGAYVDVILGVESCDFERAHESLDRMRALADSLGQPVLHWFSCYFDACWQLMHGDLAEAERLTERAMQIGNESGEPDVFMVYGAQIQEIRWMQGRSQEMVELVEQGVEANPGIPAWRAGLTQLYCWLDRSEDAAPIVEQAAADRFEHLPRDLVLLTALAFYADAASQIEPNGPAEILYRIMEPWPDRMIWNGANAYGQVGMYLGLLATACGWDERADEHLAKACEFHEENGFWFWAARSHLGWAQALARRGDKERAHAQAQRALELARERGYAVIEPRAAAVLEAGSAAPR